MGRPKLFERADTPTDEPVDDLRARLRGSTTAEELDEVLGTADRIADLIAAGDRTAANRADLQARVEADTL